MPNRIDRDHNLAIIRYINNQNLKNMKKQTIKIFKDIGFKITIDIGMTKCNFLDITLDLANSCYTLYIKKENSSTRYINFNLNHPTIIKKNLPKSDREKIKQTIC